MADTQVEQLELLVEELGSKNAMQRRHARAVLAEAGEPAVPLLLAALDSPTQHLRWEAAKSLGELAHPAAAEGLVAAIGDKDQDVRWVVGDALIRLGDAAVHPLLVLLSQSDLPDEVLQSAHHVLHGLLEQAALRELLDPVWRALQHAEPRVAVPVAASEAIAKHTT